MRTSEFLIRFFFHPAKKKRKVRCHTASHARECVKYCSIWSKSLILQIFSGGTNMYSDTSLLAFDFVPWIVSYLAHSLLTPRHLLRTLPRTLINMKHVIVFFWCHLQRWMPLIIWDKCCVASCGRSSLSFTQVNPANPQYNPPPPPPRSRSHLNSLTQGFSHPDDQTLRSTVLILFVTDH